MRENTVLYREVGLLSVNSALSFMLRDKIKGLCLQLHVSFSAI